MTGPPMPPDTFRLANTAGPTTAPTPPRGGRSPYITVYAGVVVLVAMSALVLLWPPAIFAVAVVIIAGGYVTSVVYRDSGPR